MKIVIAYLVPFVGKHWLRLAILGGVLFLMTKKQVGLSIQLGQSAQASQNEQVNPHSQTDNKGGLFGSWRLFRPKKIESGLFLALKEAEEARIQAFLNRFSAIAKREQEEFGIPASIVLSNALLQSKAGSNTLVERGNNFFGLTCTKDWKGPEQNVDGKCYRAYPNAFTSFRDHSLFITTGPYLNLQKLTNKDYKAWAKGLEEFGFNGTPELQEQLLSTINQWQLFRFDE